MRSWVVSAVLWALGLGAVSAEAKILVLQFSDSHSNYAQLPNFIRSVSALSQNFLREFPDGTVVLLANGDIAGTSKWAEYDKGALSYKLLSELSSLYNVVVTLGNHEGIDLRDDDDGEGAQPNGVFVLQQREFLEKFPGKVLAANVVPTDLGKEFFSPYQDIAIRGGRRLRVIGETVKNFGKESIYNFKAGPQVFLPDQPDFIETAKEQLAQAANDGVNIVLYAMHEMSEVVSPAARAVLDYRRQNPELLKVATPLFSSGHKHEIVEENIDGTYVVEAGAMYAFTAITIDDELGVVEKLEHYSHEKQKQFSDFTGLREAEENLVKQAETIVSAIRIENAQTFPVALPQLSDDANTKLARRSLSGRLIARSFVHWATHSLKAPAEMPKVKGIIGMMNTLSFWDVPSLFEGNPVTRGEFKDLLPFNGPVKARVMKGSDVAKVFRGMRQFGENSPAPFVTPEPSQDMDGLDANELYLLITDGFTGMNGYKIPELNEAYQNEVYELAAAPKIRDVFSAFLEASAHCRKLLGN